MKRSYRFLSVLLALLLIFTLISGAAAGGSLLEEVRDLINKNYVDPVPPQVLQQDTIEATLETLGDPYSDYFDPNESKYFYSTLEGNFVGIGMVVEQATDYPRVSGLLPNTPAANAGIQVGDLVLAVDGIDVRGWSLQAVVSRIRGPLGTAVVLTLLQEGIQDPVSVSLVRQEIKTDVVYSELRADGVGYLRLSSFTREAPRSVENELQGLLARGAKGVVLDLRDNPGGYLDSAIEIAGSFLSKGKTVVRIEYRNEEVIETSPGPGRRLPLAVLVNGESASAAEILAGTLQDNRAAVVVGEITYGKGTVQSLYDNLSNGGTLKLTVARYLTPESKQVNGVGIAPDMVVAGDEEQLKAAVARVLTLAEEIIVGEEQDPAGNTTGGEEQQVAGSTKMLLLYLGKTTVLAGHQSLNMDAAPYIRAGRTMVPLRFVAEQLGAVVSWDPFLREVRLQRGTVVIEVPVGGEAMRVNGISRPLETPVEINGGGRTFIPLRAVGETLGASVDWNPEGQFITIGF